MQIPQKTIRFLWHFINKQRWGFAALTIASLAKTLANTIWPVIIGNIIDQLNQANLAEKEVVLTTIINSLMIASAFWILIEILIRARGYIMAYVFPKMEASMRTEIFHKVSDHSYHFFVSSLAGSVSRRLSEISRSSSFIIDILLTSIQPMFVSMLIAAYICLSLHPLITTLLIGWMVLHILLSLIFGNKSAFYSALQSEASNELQGKITDSLVNNLNVKLFSARRHEFAYVQAAQEEEKKKNIKSYLYIENVKIILSLVSAFAMFAIFGFALKLWSNNQITLGDTVIIFNLVANLMMQLWTSADDLTYLFQEIGICQEGLSILQDKTVRAKNYGHNKLVVSKGKIEFVDVTFKYRKNSNLFENQSVIIGGGQKIGLVGFSGSGKTTFVNLLLRLYEIEKGKILIDGQNIASVTEESLRAAIAMIPQEPILFHRSIFENIRYGNFNASFVEVEEAAKKASCHDFIMRMEKGYDTIVGERGGSLSGGQRQRLSIARALLKKAKIIILDEATSALDTITERKIKKSLEALMQDNTALIIAHRLSTLLHVDRILVFDNGSIVEDGSHAELLALDGLYAKLWRMQNDGILPKYRSANKR
jgi:ATP-binding cassette subfamily B protein